MRLEEMRENSTRQPAVGMAGAWSDIDMTALTMALQTGGTSLYSRERS